VIVDHADPDPLLWTPKTRGGGSVEGKKEQNVSTTKGEIVERVITREIMDVTEVEIEEWVERMMPAPLDQDIVTTTIEIENEDGLEAQLKKMTGTDIVIEIRSRRAGTQYLQEDIEIWMEAQAPRRVV
jgi:hypothetical protein